MIFNATTWSSDLESRCVTRPVQDTILVHGVQEAAMPFHRSQRSKLADRDDANKDLRYSVSLSNCLYRFDTGSTTQCIIMTWCIEIARCQISVRWSLPDLLQQMYRYKYQSFIVHRGRQRLFSSIERNLTRPLSFFWHALNPACV